MKKYIWSLLMIIFTALPAWANYMAGPPSIIDGVGCFEATSILWSILFYILFVLISFGALFPLYRKEKKKLLAISLIFPILTCILFLMDVHHFYEINKLAVVLSFIFLAFFSFWILLPLYREEKKKLLAISLIFPFIACILSFMNVYFDTGLFLFLGFLVLYFFIAPMYLARKQKIFLAVSLIFTVIIFIPLALICFFEGEHIWFFSTSPLFFLDCILSLFYSFTAFIYFLVHKQKQKGYFFLLLYLPLFILLRFALMYICDKEYLFVGQNECLKELQDERQKSVDEWVAERRNREK